MADNATTAPGELSGAIGESPSSNMAHTNLSDFGIGQVFNAKIQDALAELVNRKFTEAKDHRNRTGITDRLTRNLYANKCEYRPDEKGLLGPFSDIYIGISALKARAAASWIVDIILNNIDKPWTLDPTIEPDLPDRLKEQVIDVLMQELPAMNTYEALKDRASQLKATVQNISYKQAQASTKRMETTIQDQLSEGGWAKLFTKFVDDLVVYPTALIRGPIEVSKPTPSWDGNKFEVKHRKVLINRVISPWDAYPAPNSTNTQDGDYFIEKTEFSQSDLYNTINSDGFINSNVRQALHKYEHGHKVDELDESTKKMLEGKDDLLDNSNGVDVIIYNGKIQGKKLAEHGVVVADPQKYYEAEVWVVGEYTIRAILTPNPVGTRPIYSTSYRKVVGSFWGDSVIDLSYDVGRVCNAAARATVRNMGYSSGPIGEVVSDRIDTTDNITDLRPYKIFRVGPDLTGTGAPAFRFHNVSSIVGELERIFAYYMKLADDLTGVPAYVLGNPQVAGAGRTLGGLSMLMGNAAKGIKHVQLSIDQDIITDLVTAYYYYNMQTSKDPSIKADAKVIARGATGLLQRELSQSRTVEILQLLTPYAQMQYLDKTAILYLLRDLLKNTGIDVDKAIPDPDKTRGLQELASLYGGTAQALDTGTNNPPNLPPQSIPQAPANLAPFPRPVNLAQGA